MKQIRLMVTVCIALSCAVLVAGVSTAGAVVEGSVGKLTNKPKGDKCKLVAKRIQVTNVGPDSSSEIMLSMYLSPEPQVTAAATLLDSFTKDTLGVGDMFGTSDDKKKYKLKKKVDRSQLAEEPWVIVVLDDPTQMAGGAQIFLEQVSECEAPQSTGSPSSPPVASAPPGPLASGPLAAAASVILGFAGIGNPQTVSAGGGGSSISVNTNTPSDLPVTPNLPDFELPDFPDFELPDLPDFDLPSFVAGATRTPQSATRAFVTPCAFGGTRDIPLDVTRGGATVFDDCQAQVDTTGDGVPDAVEIQTGTITTTLTDTGSTTDLNLTTRRERLIDRQFISQDIAIANSQTTNTQTEECDVLGSSFPFPVQTLTASTSTTQETADTNGDGTIDKDIDTTTDGRVDTTFGLGAGSICDTFLDNEGPDLSIAITFSGNSSAVDNLSGQTMTVSVDQSRPVSTTIVSSLDGTVSRSTVDGSGTINLGLPCVNGNVTFTIVDSVVVQGGTPVAGQIAISGAVSGVVSISPNGVQVTEADGTTGFINLAVVNDIAWACSPPEF